jgi:hypothetical protein
VAAIWVRQDLPIPAGLDSLFKLHAATQAAPAARPLAPAPVPVQSNPGEQASKLQLSYQIETQPPLEIAAQTIVQAPDLDKE